MSWIVHLLPYLDERRDLKHVDSAAGAYDAKNAAGAGDAHRACWCARRTPAAEPAGIGMSNYAGCHHDVEAPDRRRQPRRALPQQPHRAPGRDRRAGAHDLRGRETGSDGRPGLDVRHAGDAPQHGHADQRRSAGRPGDLAVGFVAGSAPAHSGGATSCSATAPSASARRSTWPFSSSWATAPTASSSRATRRGKSKRPPGLTPVSCRVGRVEVVG